MKVVHYIFQTELYFAIVLPSTGVVSTAAEIVPKGTYVYQLVNLVTFHKKAAGSFEIHNS